MGDVKSIGSAAPEGTVKRAAADTANELRDLAARIDRGEVTAIAVAHSGSEHVSTWFQTIDCGPSELFELIGALEEVKLRMLAHAAMASSDSDSDG